MISDAIGLQLTQDMSCNFSVMEYKQIYAINVMRCKNHKQPSAWQHLQKGPFLLPYKHTTYLENLGGSTLIEAHC